MSARANHRPPPPGSPANGRPPGPAPAPRGRPSWSGLLRLSLVAVPVQAYPAVRSGAPSPFQFLHADCGQRIAYPKHCPRHGAVPAEAIVRGYEYAPDQYVVVEPQELDRLRPARDKALLLEQCLPVAQEVLAFLKTEGKLGRTPSSSTRRSAAAIPEPFNIRFARRSDPRRRLGGERPDERRAADVDDGGGGRLHEGTRRGGGIVTWTSRRARSPLPSS